MALLMVTAIVILVKLCASCKEVEDADELISDHAATERNRPLVSCPNFKPSGLWYMVWARDYGYK